MAHAPCLDNLFLNGLQNIHASLNSFECADVSELLPFMWHYNWRPWIASIALVFSVQCSYRSWVSPDAQKFGSDPTELGTCWDLAFYEEPLTATCIECKQLNFLIENCTGYACPVGMIVKCLADLAVFDLCYLADYSFGGDATNVWVPNLCWCWLGSYIYLYLYRLEKG
jgi:hypothetical protein